VESIGSILVALDRGATSLQALSKAVMIARRFDARLHLYLCDAERAYVLRHQYDTPAAHAVLKSAVGEAHEFLQNLWGSLAVDDLRADFDAASESPLCEAIVRKVRHSGADLVIRAIGADGTSPGSIMSATDLELVRTCPVPLLLTRIRPWSPTPRFAVAIDLSDEERPRLTSMCCTAPERSPTHRPRNSARLRRSERGRCKRGRGRFTSSPGSLPRRCPSSLRVRSTI